MFCYCWKAVAYYDLLGLLLIVLKFTSGSEYAVDHIGLTLRHVYVFLEEIICVCRRGDSHYDLGKQKKQEKLVV